MNTLLPSGYHLDLSLTAQPTSRVGHLSLARMASQSLIGLLVCRCVRRYGCALFKQKFGMQKFPTLWYLQDIRNKRTLCLNHLLTGFAGDIYYSHHLGWAWRRQL
jgi:hypothetical protein